MNLLAIDTSTERLSLALKVGETILQKTLHEQRAQAQEILPQIGELFKEADCHLGDLDGFVFGRGPGSFTGLRIAAAVIKGLGYGRKLPVYPVSTLAAIAEAARQQGVTEPILAVMDARLQELYWGIFYPSHFEATEQVSSPKAIQLSSEDFVLAGLGFEPYQEMFPKNIKKSLKIYPEASIMLKLVEYGTIPAVSAKNAELLYIRNNVTQGEKGG